MHDNFLDERTHSVLQMVRSIVNASLLEPRFRPSPESFNRIERARVASVENHLNSALFCLCLDTFCAVDAKVINKHDALAPMSILGHLLKKVAVGKLVNGLVNYMDCDNDTIHVDGSGDSNRLKSQLFSLDHHRFALWCVPNFRLNLVCRKHRLIHEEEFLFRVNCPEEPREGVQPSLPLPAELPISELDVDTQDTLLDAMFAVKLPQTVNRDWVAGPTTIKRLNTLPKA